MLIPFISSFRIEVVIIFAATIVTGMTHWNDCSSSSRSNNNKARGRPRKCPTTSDTPSGINLDLVDRNRSQSDTPHGISCCYAYDVIYTPQEYNLRDQVIESNIIP